MRELLQVGSVTTRDVSFVYVHAMRLLHRLVTSAARALVDGVGVNTGAVLGHAGQAVELG